MALHELATNAVKYGALSVPCGRIHLEWSIAGESAKPLFHMNWTERDGPSVAKPKRTGFGHTVVEAMIRHDLKGEAYLHFHPTGVVWTLSCPTEKALEG